MVEVIELRGQLVDLKQVSEQIWLTAYHSAGLGRVHSRELHSCLEHLTRKFVYVRGT
jgi:hypothetical protein